MRELIQQEIDNDARLGVDHVVWWSGEPMIDRLAKVGSSPWVYWEESLRFFGDEDYFALLPSKPIPRKPFDISEYEFSDSIAGIEVVSANEVAVCIKATSGKWIAINEQDVDAMKQHFTQAKAKAKE